MSMHPPGPPRAGLGTPACHAASQLPCSQLHAPLAPFSARSLLPVNADSDIAYAIKPAWASYLAFIDQVQADGAFQAEYGMSAFFNTRSAGAVLHAGLRGNCIHSGALVAVM